MLGCKSLLHKLCPLAPGALELLQMQCSRGCKRVFAAWERTLAYAEGERRPLHVSEFMPALQPHAPHLRLVLQITGTLMHGVRVLYVQNRHEDHETVVVVDANYVSFLAHDGQQELLFSSAPRSCGCSMSSSSRSSTSRSRAKCTRSRTFVHLRRCVRGGANGLLRCL